MAGQITKTNFQNRSSKDGISATPVKCTPETSSLMS